MVVAQAVILDDSAAWICWSWMIPAELESCCYPHWKCREAGCDISEGLISVSHKAKNLPVRVKGKHHKTMINLSFHAFLSVLLQKVPPS